MYAVQHERETPLLPPLPVDADLFGQVLMDYHLGIDAGYFIRRDDNYGGRDRAARYFRSWTELPEHQRCLLNHARGQVLDIGAGAGQHALALQERGLAVTAIDRSPLAVEVCRARGVRDIRLMDVMELSMEVESIDTALLLGNNIGIAGTLEGLRRLLGGLRRVVRPGGQVLADFNDYTATHNPINLRYHRWNLARGRYPGSVGMRIEYHGRCTPVFQWLLPRLSDLRRICADSGWKVVRCVQVTEDSTYAIGMERA